MFRTSRHSIVWLLAILALVTFSTVHVIAEDDTGEVPPPDQPLIDAGSSTIAAEMSKELLDELPNGRTVFDFVSMLPGVAGLEVPYRRGDSTLFHVHGGNNLDNTFLVNGLETTDTATGHGGITIPWEAIESVEVITGGMPAEYGRATGGIVNIETRSGGNQFHGSVPIHVTDDGMQREQGEESGGGYQGEDFKETEWGASLGGPVVREHLWFFGTYNQFTRTITAETYEDDSIERDEAFTDGLANLNWQINKDNKIKFQYASNAGTWDSRDAESQTLEPTAWSQLEAGGSLWQLKWNSIFTPNLFLEAQLGQHETTWTIGPANAGFHDPRFIDQTGDDPYQGTIIYGNVSSITDVHQPRTQYKAVLNYFQGGWAGEHSFKFGVEYHDLEYETDLIYPDTYTINRPNNLPDHWAVTSDVNYLDTGKILTLFAQDSWTWNEDWSFNLGLRLEQMEQNNDVGEEVYSFDNLLSPRLGVAWDINGDGRSKLFAHFGRYHHAVGLTLASTLNRQRSESWSYEGNYETGDWEEIYHTTGSENPTIVDPTLTPNVKDEFILGYETEFATDFVAGARLIRNSQSNMIEDVLANEDEIRDDYSNEYIYRITNVQSARRNYQGLELTCRKRLSNNYQFLVVATISRAKGSVVYGGHSEGLDIYADFEEMKYNRYGSLPWDDQQYLKFNGSYHLPLGFIVGGSLNWRSGRPYSRIDYGLPESAWNFGGYTGQYYLDPRGSERMGSVMWIDLRLRKDFSFGPTVLSLTADAFNLTNSQDAIGVNELDSYSYGEANRWMKGGYYVLGARLSF